MAKPNRYLQRIQIFVERDTQELLVQLAALDGVTVSTLVRELLETLTPGLRSTVEMIQASRNLDSHARAKLTATLQGHADKLKSDTDYVMESAKKELENL